MKDVNIYTMGISINHIIDAPGLTNQDYLNNKDIYNAKVYDCPNFITTSAGSAFDERIKEKMTWSVDSISSEFVRWMSDGDAEQGTTSLIGLLSSIAFESLISECYDKSLGKDLRLLVEVTSILYCNGGRDTDVDPDPVKLRSIRSLVGKRLLQGIEPALGNTSLATFTLEQLKALFLVLFATITAVGYSRPYLPSQPNLGSEVAMNTASISLKLHCSPPTMQVFFEAQKQLLRILTHHMIYLGERINLLDDSISKKLIVEGSHCQWKRKPAFEWKELSALDAVDTQASRLAFPSQSNNRNRTDQSPPTQILSRRYPLTRSLNDPIEGPSPMNRLPAREQYQFSMSTQIAPAASLDSKNTGSVYNMPTQDHYNLRLPVPIISRALEAFEVSNESCNMRAPAANLDAPFKHVTNFSDSTTTFSLSTLLPSHPSASKTCVGTTSDTELHTPPETLSDELGRLMERPKCRLCGYATSPYETSDQEDLCQFCSSLPRLGGAFPLILPEAGLNETEEDGRRCLTSELAWGGVNEGCGADDGGLGMGIPGCGTADGVERSSPWAMGMIRGCAPFGSVGEVDGSAQGGHEGGRVASSDPEYGEEYGNLNQPSGDRDTEGINLVV